MNPHPRGSHWKRAVSLCIALLTLCFAGTQVLCESSCAELQDERLELVEQLIEAQLTLTHARLAFPAAKREAEIALKVAQKAQTQMKLARELLWYHIRASHRLREKGCSGDRSCAIHRHMVAQARLMVTEARERLDEKEAFFGEAYADAIQAGFRLMGIEWALQAGGSQVGILMFRIAELDAEIASACSGLVGE